MSNPNPNDESLSRIEITETVDDTGDLLHSFQLSEGMTFGDAVKLLEMTKLSLHELYRDGHWEDL